MLKKSFVLTRGVITIGVVFLVIVTLVSLISYGVAYVRMDAGKAICACNLHDIGVAFNVYANENEGMFPMIPLGSGQIIGEDQALVNVKKHAKEDPFIDLPTDADKSVSMNVWLLCRLGTATPASFLCPVMRDMSWEGECLVDGKENFSPKAFSNFPWSTSGMTISYSFPQPWSNGSKWDGNAKPGTVIGADANNGLQPDYVGDGLPLSNRELKKYVNSVNHWGRSQNVLHIDGSVSCDISPYVGLEQDNIYTALPEDYTGKPGATPGLLNVRPRDTADAVLIPNIGTDLAKWNRKP